LKTGDNSAERQTTGCVKHTRQHGHRSGHNGSPNVEFVYKFLRSAHYIAHYRYDRDRAKVITPAAAGITTRTHVLFVRIQINTRATLASVTPAPLGCARAHVRPYAAPSHSATGVHERTSFAWPIHTLSCMCHCGHLYHSVCVCRSLPNDKSSRNAVHTHILFRSQQNRTHRLCTCACAHAHVRFLHKQAISICLRTTGSTVGC
jgi:hypothetical protein